MLGLRRLVRAATIYNEFWSNDSRKYSPEAASAAEIRPLNRRAADSSNSTSENFKPQAGHYPAGNVGFCAAGNPGFSDGV
jgi:hypothetical protein